jgi:hypothetical protein
MRRADFWADHPHYIDHLAPIYLALEPALRGHFWAPVNLHDHARGLGIERPELLVRPARALRPTQRRDVVVVGAYGGVLAWRPNGRQMVLVNHGSGQTFVDVDHPSYSGGRNREDIALFIEPGPHAAEATRRSGVPGIVVEAGCAKLDPWHRGERALPSNERPVVCIATHWDCKVCPETRSAFNDYLAQLATLAQDERWTLIGHGHPLILRQLVPLYDALGIETIPTFDGVLDRADLFISDGSSTLYEFAATGRPVLCLNAREFRRDVEHGLRFWDAMPGLDIWPDENLVDAVSLALTDPPEAQARRAHGLSRAYAPCDGQAARRAADAIAELCRRPAP